MTPRPASACPPSRAPIKRTRRGRTLLAGALLWGALAAGAPGPEGLRLALGVEKPAYAPGERIAVTFRLTHDAAGPLRLAFPTSQRYDLALEDAEGREVWRWSRGRMFLQAFGQEVVPPGEEGLRFSAEAPAPAEPGRYVLRGRIAAAGRDLEARVAIRVR